ncbi:hypothetical protein CBR58_32455 [Bacillus thuringiensis]|nr:hypothetical protein [Bacillus thuringiensis]PNK40961.1 hypothetical protein CBR58_32455 [Bacillus thuringiensis]RUR57955.1 hypothetical protein ELS81_31450 [Bacillus sp. VKPM B-3276]
MSTKFFISFVACDVNVIGDLFYITLHLYNRQHLFIKIFKLIFYALLTRHVSIGFHYRSTLSASL